MTERKRLVIYEERLAIHARDMGICQACRQHVGLNEFEIAHRIANTVANRKHWGDAIIDHPLNKATTHAGKCNDKMNCGFNPAKCQAIVDAIKECMNGN